MNTCDMYVMAKRCKQMSQSDKGFDREPWKCVIMLDTYSELGRPPIKEIFTTMEGPLTRRGLTLHPPAGDRGIGLKPPKTLEDQVWSYFVCLTCTAVAGFVLFFFCDLGLKIRSTEGKCDAT